MGELIPEHWKKTTTPDEASHILELVGKRIGEKSQVSRKKEEIEVKKLDVESADLDYNLRKKQREVITMEKAELYEGKRQEYIAQGDSPLKADSKARIDAFGSSTDISRSDNGPKGKSGGMESAKELLNLPGVKQVAEGLGSSFGQSQKARAEIDSAVAEIVKNNLATNRSTTQSDQGSNIKFEDVKSAPQDREITWTKNPNGGYSLKNTSVNGGDSGASPAGKLREWIDGFKELKNGFGEVAETLGYSKSDNNRHHVIELKHRAGDQELTLPFELTPENSLDFLNYLGGEEERRGRGGRHDALLLTLNNLVAFFAGVGSPQEVFEQAKGLGDWVKNKYRGSPREEAGKQEEAEQEKVEQVKNIHVVCSRCKHEFDISEVPDRLACENCGEVIYDRSRGDSPYLVEAK